MRKFLLAVIAALFATVTMSAFAADPVKTDPATSAAKPGRAIDDAVKTDPSKSTAKPGRAADEEKPATEGGGKKKKGKKKKKAE